MLNFLIYIKVKQFVLVYNNNINLMIIMLITTLLMIIANDHLCHSIKQPMSYNFMSRLVLCHDYHGIPNAMSVGGMHACMCVHCVHGALVFLLWVHIYSNCKLVNTYVVHPYYTYIPAPASASFFNICTLFLITATCTAFISSSQSHSSISLSPHSSSG